MNQSQEASEDWNQFGEETALVFKQQSDELFGSVQARTVLGRQATLPAIAAAVRWAFLGAKSGDLVVVHINCHGGTEPKDGWSVDTMDGQWMYGRDLKSAAANVPCPVLFMIDTCGSGGFARPHKKDIALPDNCVAICSSRSRQSTTNVLNIAMNEALWGAGDTNDNDTIELDELISYIENRSRKISPKAGTQVESEFPVIVVGANFPRDLPLTNCSEDLIAIIHERTWHLGRRLGQEGDNVKVHVMGYQDDPSKSYFYFNEVLKNRVFPINAESIPVIVTHENRERPALAIKWEHNEVTVRFVLSKKQPQEVVERAAVRLPFPRLIEH